MNDMHVTIKTPEEQEKMRVAGRLAAEVLDMIGEHVVPGVTTEELDKLCHDYIVGVQGSIPANLNYRGFPKTICTSVNHVVCHGIPNEKRLKAGDFVNIDVTVIRDGFHGDTSRMYFVGKPPAHAQRLAETCFAAMWRGIETVKPGMTFTIEPMVNAGKRHVRLLPDGWTVITKDHSLSAQWEHTVLVTDTGVDVLTLGANGGAALGGSQSERATTERAQH